MLNKFTQLVDKHYDTLNDARSLQHRYALASIILIAFILRMMGVFLGQGYHYFAIGDELMAYGVALDFLAGDPKAYYIGQPTFSNGFVPGPFWTLFWVFLLKAGGNTIHGAIIVMTLINVLVVYLFYLFSRNIFNPAYSLFSALFFATAPWPIYFSAGLWNPLPLAFLGVILFLSLWKVTQQDQSWHIFIVCLVAAIIPQFHMIGIFYIPAILLLLYLSPSKINRRWFMAGIAAGVCVYLPYIIGEILNNWENTKAVLGANKRASISVFKILTAPLNVLSNLPGRWAGEGFTAMRDFGNARFGSVYIMLIFNLMSVVLTLLIAGSFLRKFFSNMRGKWFDRATFADNPAIFFIGVLLIIPPLLFLVTGHNYASRYTILVFPLLFLLPALFIRGLSTPSRRSLVGLVSTVLMIFNIYMTSSFFLYQEKMIKSADFFMPSFKKMEQLRQVVVQHAGPEYSIRIDNSSYIDDKPKEIHLVKSVFPLYMSLKQKNPHTQDQSTPEKTYYLVQLSKYDIRGLDVIHKGNGIAITLQKPQITVH